MMFNLCGNECRGSTVNSTPQPCDLLLYGMQRTRRNSKETGDAAIPTSIYTQYPLTGHNLAGIYTDTALDRQAPQELRCNERDYI